MNLTVSTQIEIERSDLTLLLQALATYEQTIVRLGAANTDIRLSRIAKLVELFTRMR